MAGSMNRVTLVGNVGKDPESKSFNGLTGIVEQYVRKGSKVLVEGKLQTRKWQDQSGSDRYSTEVVLQGPDARIILLDGKPQGQAGSSSSPQSPPPATGTDLDDDVPF